MLENKKSYIFSVFNSLLARNLTKNYKCTSFVRLLKIVKLKTTFSSKLLFSLLKKAVDESETIGL